jgi:hypothetical protein
MDLARVFLGAFRSGWSFPDGPLLLGVESDASEAADAPSAGAVAETHTHGSGLHDASRRGIGCGRAGVNVATAASPSATGRSAAERLVHRVSHDEVLRRGRELFLAGMPGQATEGQLRAHSGTRLSSIATPVLQLPGGG